MVRIWNGPIKKALVVENPLPAGVVLPTAAQEKMSFVNINALAKSPVSVIPTGSSQIIVGDGGKLICEEDGSISVQSNQDLVISIRKDK